MAHRGQLVALVRDRLTPRLQDQEGRAWGCLQYA